MRVWQPAGHSAPSCNRVSVPAILELVLVTKKEEERVCQKKEKGVSVRHCCRRPLQKCFKTAAQARATTGAGYAQSTARCYHRPGPLHDTSTQHQPPRTHPQHPPRLR